MPGETSAPPSSVPGTSPEPGRTPNAVTAAVASPDARTVATPSGSAASTPGTAAQASVCAAVTSDSVKVGDAPSSGGEKTTRSTGRSVTAEVLARPRPAVSAARKATRNVMSATTTVMSAKRPRA